MKCMSEVIYLKNTFFHMFKYVEVVKCIEKTYVSHSVVSDFLQLHGLKPTRVLCPWNFFSTPWTVAHQGPLSMEFSRQKYWSG